ncbi:hypothetical protein Tco_0409932 [Tanacetum coccineum]
MSFVTMMDEITLESLMEEQFECFIEYYHENYPEDFKSDLENLEEVYKIMNGGVEYPRIHSTSPSETYAPYKSSPSSIAMTHKLDGMIEFPESQSKKTYKEELECDLDMMVDKVDNSSPQSTPQVLPSFEVIFYKKKLGSSLEVSLDDSWIMI